MPADTVATFDGLSIALNRANDPLWSSYYLVHSFGSIAGWARDRTGVQKMFDELRAAKGDRERDPGRLEAALVPFRAFETASSEYAVWVWRQADAQDVVADFSEFFRADLEAITIFHRTGRLPAWKPFLAEWHRTIESGQRRPSPFAARPIEGFRPVPIDLQEVKQAV
jgi:hypothetical protein